MANEGKKEYQAYKARLFESHLDGLSQSSSVDDREIAKESNSDAFLIKAIADVSLTSSSEDLWTTFWNCISNSESKDITDTVANSLAKAAAAALSSSSGDHLHHIISVLAKIALEIDHPLPIYQSQGLLPLLADVLSYEIEDRTLLAIFEIMGRLAEDFDASSNADPSIVQYLTQIFDSIIDIIPSLDKKNEFLVSSALDATRNFLIDFPIDSYFDTLSEIYARYISSDGKVLEEALQAFAAMAERWEGCAQYVASTTLLKKLIDLLIGEAPNCCILCSKILLTLCGTQGFPQVLEKLRAEDGSILVVSNLASIISDSPPYMVPPMMELAASICSMSKPICKGFIDAGVFLSDKLCGKAVQSSIQMMNIMESSISYGMLPLDADSLASIYANIEICISLDDPAVIIKAIRLISVLIPMGLNFDIKDRLEELASSESPEVSEVARALQSVSQTF